MNRRYKEPTFQRCYDAAMVAAWDCASEFYHARMPRRGAGHRCAFWDGFDGIQPAYIGARPVWGSSAPGVNTT